jgi:2-polyprenyl-3-methyl-5-hydroxy-6-metoxy-1,4-benzoquinol methylase
MNFRTRSNQPELLDGNDIPFEDIRRNMRELDIINSWLGGHAITVAGVEALAGKHKKLRICEIGCGGGDNLAAIGRWAARKQIDITYIGVDINAACIAVAKERLPAGNTELITADYRDVEFDMLPDIIFSSLFCHHFKEEELVKQMQWMQRNSRIGFFINDLHRHLAAYYSIKWLTAAFSKSYLVKNDAPLSVLRGFTRSEWKEILAKAEISDYSIYWRWAFRWLIIINKNQELTNVELK